MKKSEVYLSNSHKASGLIELENARVRWFLSVDAEDIPEKIRQSGRRTYRSITIENEEIEFSDGFTDLHTISYNEILAGGGFRVSDAMKSVIIAHDIRNASIISPKGDYHPFLKKI